MVLLVITQLLGTTTICLVYGQLHGRRDGVGIHDDTAVDITGSTSGCLYQTATRAQESFLVGIENDDERHLGQIETLAQKIDTHQHIILSLTELLKDLHTVQRGNVTMYIGCSHTVVEQELAQFLGHSFGQRRDQRTFLLFYTYTNLLQQVVNLILRWTHLYLWVQQTRRTYHLFDDDTLSLLQLKVSRCGRDINSLMSVLLELLKGQRTIVEGGWQTESILHQIGLAGTVTAVHRTYLRHRDMTLVDDQQKVVREEVQETVRPLTSMSAVKVTGIVLDTRAMAQFLDHLHVVLHTLLDALRLDLITQILEELHLLDEIVLNIVNGPFGLFLGGHEEICRI